MPQSRNRSFGIATLAIVLGGVIFLLVTPSVERTAHLATVRDGDADAVEGSLRHLCWIRSGIESLNEELPSLPLERRQHVLDRAESLGCVRQLSGELQATHDLIHGDLHAAIGFGDTVIPVAMELLVAGDPDVQRRASHVLAVLADRMTDSQRAEVREVVEAMPADALHEELARALGVAGLSAAARNVGDGQGDDLQPAGAGGQGARAGQMPWLRLEEPSLGSGPKPQVLYAGTNDDGTNDGSDDTNPGGPEERDAAPATAKTSEEADALEERRNVDDGEPTATLDAGEVKSAGDETGASAVTEQAGETTGGEDE